MAKILLLKKMILVFGKDVFLPCNYFKHEERIFSCA